MVWLVENLPGFIMAASLLIAERISRAPRTDWLINLANWAINLLAAITVWRLVTGWHGVALIDAARLPWWLGVILVVLIFDLGEYVFHRLQHRIPFLWSMHSLHHSDPEMSVLTTTRHFWADPLFKTVTVWSAGSLIIMPTPLAFAVYAILGLWNFVAHARLPFDLGRWSWLINTPAYHRRHHSSEPAHFDSNFAALFPLWDVLTGSYNRPNGFPPTGLALRPRTLGQLLAWPIYYRRNGG